MSETADNTAHDAGPPWLAAAHGRFAIDRRWLIVALALGAAALTFFGWRAVLNVALTGGCAVAAHALVAWGMRHVRAQRRVDSAWHALALGLLLGLCLPAAAPAWLAAVTGAVLGVVAQGVGRTHWLRAHPVAVVMSALLLAGMLGPVGGWSVERALLAERAVILPPDRLVLGDVRDVPADVDWPATLEPWWRTAAGGDHGAREAGDAHDALWRPTPARVMAEHQHRYLVEPETFREAVRSRRVVSLAAVMLGAVPGPVGGTSVALLVLVGLWLMHERLARPGTALAALVGAAAAVCVMPVTVEEGWTWALGELAAMSAPVAVLFAAHVLLGSLLPMIVLVLAGDGQPVSPAGRLIYGLLIGAGGVAAVWFIGRPEAAYLALLVAGALARPLDWLRKEEFG